MLVLLVVFSVFLIWGLHAILVIFVLFLNLPGVCVFDGGGVCVLWI